MPRTRPSARPLPPSSPFQATQNKPSVLSVPDVARFDPDSALEAFNSDTMRPLLLPGGAGAQIKSRELKARAKAVAQAAASDGRGGDRPITLCPADDWHKGVAGRRLGPLQVRALAVGRNQAPQPALWDTRALSRSRGASEETGTTLPLHARVGPLASDSVCRVLQFRARVLPPLAASTHRNLSPSYHPPVARLNPSTSDPVCRARSHHPPVSRQSPPLRPAVSASRTWNLSP